MSWPAVDTESCSRSWTDSSQSSSRATVVNGCCPYRDGRQTEALQACAPIRRRLADWGGLPASFERSECVLAQSGSGLGAASEPGRPQLVSILGGDMPTVHYVKAKDGVNLAYQVAATGPPISSSSLATSPPRDVVGVVWPARAALRPFAIILFDKQTGLSDRPKTRARRVGRGRWRRSRRSRIGTAAIFGVSAGSPITSLHTYPERGACSTDIAGLGTTTRSARHPRSHKTWSIGTEWGSDTALRAGVQRP
jgi:hypothetical protein